MTRSTRPTTPKTRVVCLLRLYDVVIATSPTSRPSCGTSSQILHARALCLTRYPRGRITALPSHGAGTDLRRRSFAGCCAIPDFEVASLWTSAKANLPGCARAARSTPTGDLASSTRLARDTGCSHVIHCRDRRRDRHLPQLPYTATEVNNALYNAACRCGFGSRVEALPLSRARWFRARDRVPHF